MEAEEAVKQRECRLIEFIVIHEARGSSVTERYESPLLICLSWRTRRMSGMNYTERELCMCVNKKKGEGGWGEGGGGVGALKERQKKEETV